MTKTERELKIFDAFYDCVPEFTGEPLIDRKPGSDPPDVLCTTVTGRRVGVELKGVMSRSEVEIRKPRFDFAKTMRDVLGGQGRNPLKNLSHFRYGPRQKISKIRMEDREEFRRQLLEFAETVDETWDNSGWIGTPLGRCWSDKDQLFQGYPLLSKYLEYIRSIPRLDRLGHPVARPEYDWILPMGVADSYDPLWLTDEPIRLIEGAIEKYKSPHESIHELYLLLHYDMGFMYSSPATEPGVGYADHAQRAEEFLKDRGAGPFGRIFLFVALEGDEEAFQIHPSVSQDPPL